MKKISSSPLLRISLSLASPCTSTTTNRSFSLSSCQGVVANHARPATVKNNLKFSRYDPLETDFRHFYPDLIHLVAKKIGGSTPGLANQFTKVLTHNLSEAVIGKRYGLMVPRSFKELGGDPSLSEQATALGWAVELTRASANITAEVSQDRTMSRNGQPTWHRKSKLGPAAVNHAQMINHSVFILLEKYLSDHEAYHYCLQEVIEAFSHQTRGFCLDLQFNPEQQQPLLQSYDISRYKSIVYSTRSFPSLVFPISLALHLAGLHQDPVHDLARRILTDIGFFCQVQQDYDNCFKDPKEGDIAKGRVTWLIVLARQRASQVQLQELVNCYGRQEEECVQRVKQIYYELKINKNVPMYIEEKIRDIERAIQQMAKVDRQGLSQTLFFKILGEVSSDTYTFLQTSSWD